MKRDALNAITVSTVVKTPTAAAQHLLHGFLGNALMLSQGSTTGHAARSQPEVPAASPLTPLVELRNETAWCSGGWEVASAAVAAAVHVAHACGAAPPAPMMVQGTAAAHAAAEICMRAPSIRAAGALNAWGSSLLACALCTPPIVPPVILPRGSLHWQAALTRSERVGVGIHACCPPMLISSSFSSVVSSAGLLP